ncbi:mechanosensitive ion channel family protein [Microbacterium halophytorum]|uniref:mechanosensitive ion channel family protein n=1 Tax=Microbacterium halophytorum TaxID=2067568 RepID=UPI000CFAF034|nr:mechanosensitive ion channel domain-containing protein [Microbacterium halophytorum]
MRTELADVVETTQEHPWLSWVWVAVAVAIAVAVGFIVSFAFARTMAGLTKRHPTFGELRGRFSKAIFWAIVVFGSWFTVPRLMPEDVEGLADLTEYVLRLCSIGVLGWLIAKILIFFIDSAMQVQEKKTQADEFTLRQRRTQVKMIRRLVMVVVIVLTAGAMLLTIPGARTFGASLLASAGVASIVAGIAAQSTLGNLIAGLQLAFSNALRAGDTVEVNGEYGTVEELTLTYVVVQIWDDRRLVLPSTYFTTTPYTNWTRNQTAVTGTVYLEVDYSVDVDALRDELQMVLDSTDLWDRRSWGLVMTDAVGGSAQLRVSVTAVDADTIWALRCLVRERLVAFLARTRPDDMLRKRVIVEPPHEHRRGVFERDVQQEDMPEKAEGGQ